MKKKPKNIIISGSNSGLGLFLSKKFILDGKGETSRRFIYGDDIVSAIEILLFKAPIKNEYNFSGDEEITIFNLVRLICELTSTNFDDII